MITVISIEGNAERRFDLMKQRFLFQWIAPRANSLRFEASNEEWQEDMSEDEYSTEKWSGVIVGKCDVVGDDILGD